jgi:hypothetical protein
MKRWMICGSMLCMVAAWANTIDLLNDSSTLLKVDIYDVDGHVVSEMVMHPDDTAQWSDNVEDFDTEANLVKPQAPYQVVWSCMDGSVYGICNDVSPNDMINAQSCGGDQACGGE